MLSVFVGNAGRVLGKQELIELVWPNIHVSDDSLFQCIRELRAALGDEQRQLIKLVSGRGYLFDAKITRDEVAAARQAEPGDEAAPAPAEASTLAFAPTIAEVGAAMLAAEPRAPQARRKLLPFLPREGWHVALIAAAAALIGAVVGLATGVFALGTSPMAASKPPIVAVLPIASLGEDQRVTEMAAKVSAQLADGLSGIGNVRVVAPASASAGPPAIAGRRPLSLLVFQGELQRSGSTWNLEGRLTDAATGEVLWSVAVPIDAADGDALRQQARLVAGVGYPLAMRLNALVTQGTTPQGADAGALAANAKLVIEQATAFVNHSTAERFHVADALLKEALARDPENADLEIALATHRLRGIQSSWYPQGEEAKVEASADDMLLAALKARPSYLPALGGYCRFLTATNRFTEALIACAKTLSLNPWDGAALYQTGLALVQLGRFEEAAATFERADQYDTPRVARWTWLLGAAWNCLHLHRDEDAVRWITRSIAITPGTGRSYFILAIAYWRLGRKDDARIALAKGLELRPGSTTANVPLPPKNASPLYLQERDEELRILAEIGLPQG